MKRIAFITLILLQTIFLKAEDYLSVIQKAWNVEDFAAVIDNANKLLSKSPKSTVGFYYRGMAYFHTEMYGQAISDFTFAIKHCSKKDTIVVASDIYGYRAKTFVITGDTASALKDYSAAIKINPNDAELYINRGVLYENKLQYAEAESDYKKALDILQYNVDVEMRLAYCQTKQGKVSDAKATLERVIRMNPRNFDVKKEMALLCKSDNDIKSFVDYYIEYLEYASDGDDEMLVEASRDEYDYTVSAIEKVLGETKYKSYWLSIRVKVDMANNHYDVAIESLKKIEEIHSDSIVSPFVYYRMAVCYSNIGEYSKAVSYYTTLIDFEENDNSLDADDIFGRGLCYENMGSFDNAMADYNRALSMKDNDAEYLCHRGMLYEKIDSLQAAKVDYDKAIASDKDLAVAYLLRGKLLMRDFNDTNAAKSDFDEVLRLDTVVKSDSHRAQALCLLGKDNEAVAWINKMLGQTPVLYSVYYEAACLYALMGVCDSAVTYLGMAFEMRKFNNVQVQRERDFDNVRQCENFKALISQHSGKKLQEMFDSLKK